MYYNENELIFVTGAPGSKWSNVTNLLSDTEWYVIDKSDRNEDREYEADGASHKGSYYGPGFGVGEKFFKLPDMTKQEFLEECFKPFQSTGNGSLDNGYKFIRCHQFIFNIDWLEENFPNNQIIYVHRPEREAITHWQNAGGVKIGYPLYFHWYGNGYHGLIRDEVQKMEQLFVERDYEVYLANKKHFTKYWNTEWTEENLDRVSKLGMDTLISYRKPIDETPAYVYYENKKRNS